jgi:hypothetical protein
MSPDPLTTTCCAAILGRFNAAWRSSGRAPLQLFTKFVPNIFQQRLTPAAVEAAIQRSLNNLQVGQTGRGVACAAST